jgi:hypothetical protein
MTDELNRYFEEYKRRLENQDWELIFQMLRVTASSKKKKLKQLLLDRGLSTDGFSSNRE